MSAPSPRACVRWPDRKAPVAVRRGSVVLLIDRHAILPERYATIARVWVGARSRTPRRIETADRSGPRTYRVHDTARLRYHHTEEGRTHLGPVGLIVREFGR